MSDLNITHVYRVYTLLLLKADARHGYEIIDQIETMTGDEPSTSHIYPFLGKLEDQGYVSVEKGSRGKKVYSLTDEGETFVGEQLDAFGEMLYTAIQDKVRECSHCACKVYDDGYEEDGEVYCCKHCARAAEG